LGGRQKFAKIRFFWWKNNVLKDGSCVSVWRETGMA